MNNFLTEFKKFITRGNVFELAIAVVIGGAFSRIVQSLVNDIVMPLLSLLVGRVPFAG
jgi:large conductance mechanosensitive channel